MRAHPRLPPPAPSPPPAPARRPLPLPAPPLGHLRRFLSRSQAAVPAAAVPRTCRLAGSGAALRRRLLTYPSQVRPRPCNRLSPPTRVALRPREGLHIRRRRGPASWTPVYGSAPPPGPDRSPAGVNPALLNRLVMAPPLAGAGRPSDPGLDAPAGETRGNVGLTPGKAAGGHVTRERTAGQRRLAGSGFLGNSLLHTSCRPPGWGRGLCVLLPVTAATTPEAGSGDFSRRRREELPRNRDLLGVTGSRSARDPLLPPFSRRIDSADRCGPLPRRQEDRVPSVGVPPPPRFPRTSRLPTPVGPRSVSAARS